MKTLIILAALAAALAACSAPTPTPAPSNGAVTSNANDTVSDSNPKYSDGTPK